jgi:nucleoside-diphosphate-sugar epimerase
MARIVIIGGSGHVGTYLVPALVERGHDVVNVSRGAAKPYRPHYAWSQIERSPSTAEPKIKADGSVKKSENSGPISWWT